MYFTKLPIYGIRWGLVDEADDFTLLFEYKSNDRLTENDLYTIKNEINILNNKKKDMYTFYIYKKYTKKNISCFCVSKEENMYMWTTIPYSKLSKILGI